MNLVKLREKMGYSVLRMAEELNLPPTTYQQYESGKYEPPFDRLFAMADYFNVSLDYLMGRSEISDPPADADLELAYQVNHLQNEEVKKAMIVILKNLHG